MDRNEKVKFTEEGYQEVLNAIVIDSGASSTEKAPGNISSFITQGAKDEKEAILKELATNLIM